MLIVKQIKEKQYQACNGLRVGKQVAKLVFYRKGDIQKKWIAKLDLTDQKLEIAAFHQLSFKELSEIYWTWYRRKHGSD